MDFKLTQDLKQKQVQSIKLSQSMQQSIALLQMSTMELKDYIEKEIENNPMLEVDYTNHFSFNMSDDFDIEDTGLSLQDELMRQIRYKKEKIDYALIEYLVNLLDDNGYLTEGLELIAKERNVSIDDVQRALKQIQSCYPLGVGARNLKECLLLQLNETNSLLCKKLINESLDDIALGHINKLMKKYKVDKDLLMEAIEEIKSLNPYPCSNYKKEKIHYIRPDAILVKQDDKIEIQIPSYFNLRINDCYKKMTLTKDDNKYVKDKIMQGNTLLNCIERRNATLFKIMNVLVKYQQNYLLHGSDKVPLRMCDVANLLGCHETTISRAMKNKYYEFECELYPLKHLLSKGIDGKSTNELKQVIKRFIESEDKENPLSDQKIVELLSSNGFKCSRRTVVKYREEMMILNKYNRKRGYENGKSN